jgi:hypothetical protein
MKPRNGRYTLSKCPLRYDLKVIARSLEGGLKLIGVNGLAEWALAQ